MSFTPADIAQLADHGLAVAEAERQLAQLRGGQAWTRLVRPCTLDDGIRKIPAASQAALLEKFAAAASVGSVTRFVPASGAATRMFQPLQAPTGNGAELQRFLAELGRFPFTPALAAVLASESTPSPMRASVSSSSSRMSGSSSTTSTR